LVLIPAGALTAVLATPITRLVYERGEFTASSTQLVATALVWFSLSMPFAGINLLLTRTFFALRNAWIPTGLAIANLAINAVLSFALYEPLGIAGPVIGTAAATIGMTFGQLWFLRSRMGGVEAGPLLSAVVRMVVASGLACLAAEGLWRAVDSALGVDFWAQVVAVGSAITVGLIVYLFTVLLLREEEALSAVSRIQRAIAARR
jgi:putative peptidoglycan lipid II flippase